MKKLFSFILIMLTFPTFGQDEVTKSFAEDPFNHPMLPIAVIGIFFIIIVTGACIAILYVVKILNTLSETLEKENALKQGVPYKPRRSIWDRFSQQMNASVPVSDESTIELHHSYDGIKELDNHLPPWWKYLFYGTIVWSVVYIVVYHFSDTLPLQKDEYEQELAIATAQAERFKASQPQEEIDLEKLRYTADAKLIENGKAVFIDNNCSACHRVDGGGNTIGPNLTDEYWIHGGKVSEVFTTIKAGVIEKGMPAWGKSLSPQKVRDVTFFIMSLQGTNPPNAKAPQGTKAESLPAADSLRSAKL